MGVVTAVLWNHVDDNKLLPIEQKALRKGNRGCQDALMVDSMIVKEATIKHRNLSMAWIDYQKAYDRVPHGWILEVLRAIAAPPEIIHLLENLAVNWRSVFSLSGNEEQSFPLTYKRGLFQGDSLSPLLFCLCVTPLTYALNEEKGVELVSLEGRLSHLFFMDDLKVYAKGEESLKQSLRVVDRVSRAVGMELGLRKCAAAHMRGG